MTGSSHVLSDDELDYLSILLGLIECKKWNALEYAMRSNKSVFRSFARKISRCTQLNGMTMLHACVRSDPPPIIVQLILELVPGSPSNMDCLMRCPLHVAAGTRASLPVMKILSDAYPDACDIQDIDGKTPLTLACDAACELFEGDQNISTKRGPPSFEVVKVLLKASASSVPLEDNDGMSALEHAIFSDAPIQVIKVLQNMTRKQCEMQQEQRRSLEISFSEQAHVSNEIDIPVRPERTGRFSGRR